MVAFVYSHFSQLIPGGGGVSFLHYFTFLSAIFLSILWKMFPVHVFSPSTPLNRDEITELKLFT
jgi:hypothetical protein